MIATPYAGITRVRFKGYILSRFFSGLKKERHPVDEK